MKIGVNKNKELRAPQCEKSSKSALSCGSRARHDVDLYYWRTRAGTEVDFVVYGESGLQAFEVKNHGSVHSTDLRALRPFREDYPEAETAVLYRGPERSRVDGVWCVPVEEFLRQMMPDRRLLA